MAKLVVLSEGYTGLTYELKVEKTTIGRVDDNTLCIPEASVSSHHCEIHLRGTEVVIKDLDSTNGTFIGGNQIHEATLKPGQILRLGNLQMRLESDQAAPPKKQVLDHTIALPQGVKLNELETGLQPVNFETNSPFAKKTNKTNLVFIIVGVILGLVIIGLLVYAFKQQGQSGPAPSTQTTP
ncbi:MAG: FHA domain-containing protein [Verrucomicrobiota bacterium]